MLKLTQPLVSLRVCTPCSCMLLYPGQRLRNKALAGGRRGAGNQLDRGGHAEMEIDNTDSTEMTAGGRLVVKQKARDAAAATGSSV